MEDSKKKLNSPSSQLSQSPAKTLSPERTASLKISQIIKEGQNLKFRHFSQTKSFLHIQRVDEALLFYIFHKYSSKPVLAKSQLTEDPIQLQELVGSLQLIATQAGSITIRRAEDEWDTRIKSSNPYLNRLQNNILIYSPYECSNSSPTIFENIDFLVRDPKINYPPKILNFYLEKRDHQHNLRIKYINGKTKDESAELPTYLLDPQIHIPKSVINSSRHLRKYIKKNLRIVNSLQNSEQFKIVENQEDQQHLIRFGVSYAPQILDNLASIQTSHQLSKILQIKDSRLEKQNINLQNQKMRQASKLQNIMTQVSKASAKQFISPGIILTIDSIRYFAQISVDQFKNQAWFYFMFNQSDKADKKKGKRLFEYQEFCDIQSNARGEELLTLKRIKIFPQEPQILSRPLCMIHMRWESLKDLQQNSLSILKSLEVRQLLRQFQNGEFQQAVEESQT